MKLTRSLNWNPSCNVMIGVWQDTRSRKGKVNGHIGHGAVLHGCRSKTIDFLLTAKRDKTGAKRHFDKALQAHGVPEEVTMDKCGANKAAIDEINPGMDTPTVVRQVKYLNNILEQDLRAIKRATKPMLNFKSFLSAKNVLAAIELMHMIRKGQLMMEGTDEMSFAYQFYALAGQIRPV